MGVLQLGMVDTLFTAKREKVDTSDWTPGEETYVWVHELPASDYYRLNEQLSGLDLTVKDGKVEAIRRDDPLGGPVRIVAACCFDDDGKRIFAGKESVLATYPRAFMRKIVAVYQRLNPNDEPPELSGMREGEDHVMDGEKQSDVEKN